MHDFYTRPLYVINQLLVMYNDYDFIEISNHGPEWLNGDEIKSQELRNIASEYIERYSEGIETCPFCSTNTSTLHKYHQIKSKVEHFGLIHYHGQFWICKNCHYWQYFSGRSYPQTYGGEDLRNVALAKLKNFEKDFPDECNKDVASFLKRQQDKWNELNPSTLEKYVADIFKANYHLSEVIHIGKPNDKGVDVLFIESKGKKWLIQVKRRSKISSSEGFETIQSLLGALVYHNNLNGIVVTTADHFTHHARAATEKVAPYGYVVDLVDRGKLDRMIDANLTGQPWHKFLVAQDHLDFWRGRDPYINMYIDELENDEFFKKKRHITNNKLNEQTELFPKETRKD